MQQHLVPTIIISQELHAEFRGYSLIGREFLLKEAEPRLDEAITLDGQKVVDKYWVVTKEEFMRKVPEAARLVDFDSDEVLIPTFVAQRSFKPVYLGGQ